MSAESILIILLVGLIAGWLAGQIVRGTGYGFVADICLGIVGALIGSWLFPQLGIHIDSGIIAAIVSATLGVCAEEHADPVDIDDPTAARAGNHQVIGYIAHMRVDG